MSKPTNPGLTTLEERIGCICGVIDDMKGEQIAVLDLRGLCDFTDAFVIATARSRTHLQGMTNRIISSLRDEGIRPLAAPESRPERWSAIDFGEVVVHLLDSESRTFYALEQLWGDAREVDWQEWAMA